MTTAPSDIERTYHNFYIIIAEDHETRFVSGFDYRFKRFPGTEDGQRQAQHAAEDLSRRYKKPFHVLGCIASVGALT